MGPQAALKGHRSLIREVPGLPQGGPAEPGGQQLRGDAGAPLHPQPMGLSFPLTSLVPQLTSPHPPLTPILLCPAWGLSPEIQTPTTKSHRHRRLTWPNWNFRSAFPSPHLSNGAPLCLPRNPAGTQARLTLCLFLRHSPQLVFIQAC